MTHQKCKYCGGDPIASLWDGWMIQCKNCPFEIDGEFETKEDAFITWNNHMANEGSS